MISFIYIYIYICIYYCWKISFSLGPIVYFVAIRQYNEYLSFCLNTFFGYKSRKNRSILRNFDVFYKIISRVGGCKIVIVLFEVTHLKYWIFVLIYCSIVDKFISQLWYNKNKFKYGFRIAIILASTCAENGNTASIYICKELNVTFEYLNLFKLKK